MFMDVASKLPQFEISMAVTKPKSCKLNRVITEESAKFIPLVFPPDERRPKCCNTTPCAFLIINNEEFGRFPTIRLEEGPAP
jgi:hypothetical protein